MLNNDPPGTVSRVSAQSARSTLRCKDLQMRPSILGQSALVARRCRIHIVVVGPTSTVVDSRSFSHSFASEKSISRQLLSPQQVLAGDCHQTWLSVACGAPPPPPPSACWLSPALPLVTEPLERVPQRRCRSAPPGLRTASLPALDCRRGPSPHLRHELGAFQRPATRQLHVQAVGVALRGLQRWSCVCLAAPARSSDLPSIL